MIIYAGAWMFISEIVLCVWSFRLDFKYWHQLKERTAQDIIIYILLTINFLLSIAMFIYYAGIVQ